MNIIQALRQLRDDIKSWVTTNLNALNAKIDAKTIPIDSKLSSTSTNPVQNKIVTEALNNVPRFSGNYNDLTNAPNIAEDDSGSLVIADEAGNTIFKVDADGIHTTALSLNGEAAATENYVDEAIADIDFLKTDLTNYYTKEETNNAIESVKEELSETIASPDSEWAIADGEGNVIFRVNADGAHTTDLTLNGESVTSIIDTHVAALVDSAPETLDTLNELAAALGDDPNFATTVATQIGNKVDKEDGKGLSTNDFTDAYREKLDGLENMTFEESDPTVPAWAKAENPPTYTAEDVGALPSDTPLFSGDYYDLENAPNITEDNEGNLVIADADGNIVFRSDANGFETTNLVAQTITINGSDLVALIKAEVKAYVEEYILGGEW